MNIQSSNITIMVSDMNASIKFYTETLGLQLKANYGGHYAEIAGPGITLGLHPGGKTGSKNESVSIGFSVKNFDECVNALKQKSISVDVKPDGWSRLAHFADPDGTPLYLAEAK